MIRIAAILLAAGQSKRMGVFKPLLPFGPTTVIKSCINFLRSGGIETIIVVVGTDARAAELKLHLKDSRVTFAVNPEPTSEMGASIARGLRQLPESVKAVIITPADHPAVSAEVVATLLNEWKNGARLVIPTSKGRGGHPVLVDLRFRDELLNLDTRRGLKALFDLHRAQVCRVNVDSDYIARDMDTWDDYRTLHTLVFGIPPPELPSRPA